MLHAGGGGSYGALTGAHRLFLGFFVDGSGDQHFLFVSPKRKRWQKKKRLGGFRISPQTPLKRPGKPLRFSWTFPAPSSGPVDPATCIVHGGIRDGTQAVPYAEIGIFTENSEQFRRGRPMCRPVVRTQANPYRLPNFIGSRLPHRLKRNYHQI